MSEQTEVPLNFNLTDKQFQVLFGTYLAGLEKKIDMLSNGKSRANEAVAIHNKFAEREYNYLGVVNSCPRNNVNLTDIKFDTLKGTYRRPTTLEEMDKQQLQAEINRIDALLNNPSQDMDADSKAAWKKSLEKQKQTYEERLHCL
jgi:hypothetical protein